MAWIKRNVLFVVGLAVAVALLGTGIFYLLSSKAKADEMSGQLEAKNGELDQLTNRDPSPSDANIQKAREEQERVTRFVAEARRRFTEVSIPDQLDNSSFKALLESNIEQLTQLAAESGVSLPDDKFGFTFDEQRTELRLPAKALAPFAAQLADVRLICETLFTAKVPKLLYLRRTSVGSDEPKAASYHMTSKKVVTNTVTGAISYPYEVAFQGFSSELGRVMEGFLRAPEFVVVRFINVERTASGGGGSPGLGAGPYGRDPALAARYGLPAGGMNPGMASRYGLSAPAAPAATRAGEPVLDDKPILVTLGLEIVKFPKTEVADASAPGGQR